MELKCSDVEEDEEEEGVEFLNNNKWENCTSNIGGGSAIMDIIMIMINIGSFLFITRRNTSLGGLITDAFLQLQDEQVC